MTARDVPPPLDELLARREWVRRFARTLARDDASADDLAQDAWVAAVERPPRHAEAPAGWFRRVLVRRAMDVARGTRRRESRENAASRIDIAPATDDVVATAESHRRVVDAVMALDEPYRTTVLLRFFEDLPPRDVAARMNVPVETVRSRVRRAVELLRARLDEEHGGKRSAWLVPLLGHGRDSPSPVGIAAKGAIAMTATKKAAAVVIALLVFGAGVTAFVRSSSSDVDVAAPARDAAGASTKQQRPRRTEDASVVDAAPRSAAAATAGTGHESPPAAGGGREFVVVATDPTGRIVEGIRVGLHVKGGQAVRDTGSDFSITRTNVDGRAVFRVVGDVETAWAETTDRSEYVFKGDKVLVAPGASEVRVVVEHRAWISGSVFDEDGSPLPKRDVIVLGRGRQVGRAFTDDGGRFRIDVAPGGVWDVVVTGLTSETAAVLLKPAGTSAVPDLVGEAVGVNSGAERLSIVARPTSGRRELRVRAETSDGGPLAGVNVVVMVPTSRDPVGAGTTDAAGRFDCADVPDRRVSVSFLSKQGEVPVWESAGWIKPLGAFVRPGGDDVVLIFQRGRAIRGRVDYPANVARPLESGGKPWRTIVIVQKPGDIDIVSQTSCAEDGTFTAWVPAAASGTFRVSACGWIASDGRVFQAKTVDAAAGADDVVLKLVETKQ